MPGQPTLFDVVDFTEQIDGDAPPDVARVRHKVSGRFGSTDLDHRRENPRGPLLVRWDGDERSELVSRDSVVDLQNFPTPREVVDVMLRPEQFISTGGPGVQRPSLRALGGGRTPGGVPLRVLEPAANRGAIVDALTAVGFTDVWGVELDPIYTPVIAPKCSRFFNEDYLAWAERARADGQRFDLILTNSAFNLMADYVRVSIPLMAPGGQLALFGRLAFLESDERYDLFAENACDVHVLHWRMSFVDSGKCDRWAYGWFVFGSDTTGRVYHVRKPQ